MVESVEIEIEIRKEAHLWITDKNHSEHAPPIRFQEGALGDFVRLPRVCHGTGQGWHRKGA